MSHLDRPISRRGRETLTVLGQLVRLARLERRWKTTELAERAGISRGLLNRIEKGDPSCAIGSVFEVATILGLPLLAPEAQDLRSRIAANASTMALLPRAIRTTRPPEAKDEF